MNVDFRIKSKSKRDTFVKIGKEQLQAFGSLNRCFNSIMEQYNIESEMEKKYRYDNIWFVDRYNKAITFYSDKNPIEESNAFPIRKKKNILNLLCIIKGYSSFNDCVPLTNDYGRYTPYIKWKT